MKESQTDDNVRTLAASTKIAHGNLHHVYENRDHYRNARNTLVCSSCCMIRNAENFQSSSRQIQVSQNGTKIEQTSIKQASRI